MWDKEGFKTMGEFGFPHDGRLKSVFVNRNQPAFQGKFNVHSNDVADFKMYLDGPGLVGYKELK